MKDVYNQMTEIDVIHKVKRCNKTGSPLPYGMDTVKLFALATSNQQMLRILLMDDAELNKRLN